MTTSSSDSRSHVFVQQRVCDACTEGRHDNCAKTGPMENGLFYPKESWTCLWQCNCQSDEHLSPEEKETNNRILELLREGRKYGDKIRKMRTNFTFGESSCCRAPIVYTTGGILIPTCSKCKNSCLPTRY